MDVREDIKAYLDGELAPAEAEQVRLAIEADPEAAKIAAELSAVGATLAADKREYEPKGREDMLAALRVGTMPVPRPAPKPRSWTGYYVGIGLAAAIIGVYTLSPMFQGASRRGVTAMTASTKMIGDSNIHQGEAPTARAKSPGPTHAIREESPLSLDKTAERMMSTKSSAFGPASAAKAVSPAVSLAAPGPANAKTPPLSPADKLKQLERDNEKLKTENDKLRAALDKQATTPQSLKGDLPTLPPVRPDFGMSATPQDVSPGVNAPSKGINPKKIAAFEKQVRELIVQAGGHVEHAVGPDQLRTLSATVPTSKSSGLQTKLQGLLKTAGQVSVSASGRSPNAAMIESFELELQTLLTRRERLLIDFLPDAPSVQEIDAQIRGVKASIAKLKSQPSFETLTVVIG